MLHGASLSLPGARRQDDGARKSVIEATTTAVAFSTSGREWSAITGDGLHIYSLENDMMFDPLSLDEAITPEHIQKAMDNGEIVLALRMAVHLNESGVIKGVLEDTPFSAISFVTRSFSSSDRVSIESLFNILADQMAGSPHIEFYLQWCLRLLDVVGAQSKEDRGYFMRSLRALHKAIHIREQDVRRLSNENSYLLDVLWESSEGRIV